MSGAFLPAFALSVGISGHRSLPRARLEGIERQLAEICLDLDKAARSISRQGRAYGFFEDEPTLRICSCLSEGSDRLAAYQAMARGFSLRAFLPFPRQHEAHAMDLEARAKKESREELQALCARAESVLEFAPAIPTEWLNRSTCQSILGQDDVACDFRQQAYLDAGLAMLDQSDLLIAIWSGMPQTAKGSTFDMIQTALKNGIPVIQIDSGRDASIKIWKSWEDFKRNRQGENLNVYELALKKWGLDPDLAQELKKTKSLVSSFSAAKAQPWIATLWENFQKLTARNVKNNAPYRKELSPDFRLFDEASKFCAAMDRSSFLALSILAILSVLCAALMAVWPQNFYHAAAVAILAATQVCLLGASIIWGRKSARADWRGHLTRYRYVAELLRLENFGSSLGLSCLPGHGGSSLYDKGGEDWLDYLLRNQLRLKKPPSIDLSQPEQFAALKREVGEFLIHSQMGYHEANSAKSRLMAGKMNQISKTMYYASIFVVSTRFVGALFFDLTLLTPVIAFLAVMGPVTAAQANSVSQNAEFQRLAVRSEHLAHRLKAFYKNFDKIANAHDLKSLTAKVQKLLIRDVEDWKDQYNLPKK